MPCRGLLAWAVFAREQSGGQGEVRDEADPQLPARGQPVALGVLAVEQAVVVLDRRKPGQAVGFRGGVGLAEQGAVEVRGSDRTHLPRVDQLLESAERLGDRRRLVGLVHPVVIDDVGLQAPQRRVGGPVDVLAGSAWERVGVQSVTAPPQTPLVDARAPAGPEGGALHDALAAALLVLFALERMLTHVRRR